MKKIKVGIIGAAGFSGRELTAILAADKFCEIIFLSSRSQHGQKNPHAGIFFENLSFEKMLEKKPDCVFFCTPHGVALENAEKFLAKKIRVVDLSADFRFSDPKIFEKIYKLKFKKTSENAVFGLPEFFYEKIKSAKLIANPGCFVTSALAAALPISEKFEFAIFDAKTGFSGAGVKMAAELFEKTQQNFFPYKICGHRHEAEIQQFFPQKIFFTPHLLPNFRGILTTAHFLIKKEFRDFDFFSFFKNFFAGEKYVKIQKNSPEIADVQNKNSVILGGFSRDEKGRLVIISALDNLRKGASSQAVQNFHAIFSLPKKIPEIGDTKIFSAN